jgi:transposase
VAGHKLDVSLSSVKRYTRTVLRGDILTPKKSPGRPRKVDGKATVLLEKDVQEHPTATISQRRRSLEHITGTHLSDVTVRRLMKRLGFSQKRSVGAVELDEW